MELERLYRLSIEEFSRRLQKVPGDAWDKTSKCCPDWTIRDLVNHVVGEFRWIPPLISGRTVEDVGDSLDGDLLGNDPLNAWMDAGTQLLVAMPSEDELERTVELSTGPASVRFYLSEVLSDQVIHTWDLASSIGTDEEIHSELLEFAGEFLEARVEEWRSYGVLGEPVEVPDDADEQTKLLALLGRRS
jgi:uncharacterized protein (TIGR03086 family)